MRGHFVVSLPERVVRAVAATLGGAVHEAAQLVLPRVFRRSRLYEATAKNLLRVAIELVGGVERAPTAEETPAKEIAVRKGAGNVVELGSIAAFGFSPLWLLAAASDVARGSRVYLEALAGELRDAGVLGEDVEVRSVDELLGVLERGTGRTARLIDIPPLELAELRSTFSELLGDVESMRAPEELAAVFAGLRRAAAEEQRPLLEVSAGVGLAFLVAARNVGTEHVAVPYVEDWEPLRREGFAEYARRVAQPYAEAARGHFDPARTAHTTRIIERLRRR